MIKRYLKFVKPYRYRIIATIIVGIIKFGIPMLIPLLIKYAIDGVINNHSLTNQEKFSHLWCSNRNCIIYILNCSSAD